MQQNNRVLSFLIRLDKKFGQVRSNMLMMAELPTSAQAYRILLQEKTHLDISSIETNDSMVYRVNKRKFQENGSAKNNSEYGKAKKQNFFFVTILKLVVTLMIGVGKLLGIQQISKETLGREVVKSLVLILHMTLLLKKD